MYGLQFDYISRVKFLVLHGEDNKSTVACCGTNMLRINSKGPHQGFRNCMLFSSLTISKLVIIACGYIQNMLNQAVLL